MIRFLVGVNENSERENETEEEKNKNGGEKKSSQPKTERGKAKKGGAGAAKGLRLKWIKKENNATMTKAGRYGKNKEDAERP